MSQLLQSTRSGGQLFGRVYSVIVQGASSSAIWGNESAQPSAVRVAFEVTRELTGPAKAKVALFNLCPDSRLQLVKYAPLQLRAGYAGLVGTLFTGIVAKSTTERQGPDIVTSLEAADTEPFAHMSVLNRNYDPGTPLATVLSDLAGAMFTTYLSGEVVRVSHGVAIGLPPHIYANGLAVEGPVHQTLTKICRPLGLEWSIQNGALTVIPKDHYDGRTAVVLSERTGLIGVPGDSGDCKTFSSLLNPRLVPGGLVQLQSSNQHLSGFYKVRKATYKGDSHDQAWQVDVEAVTYDGSITPLPVIAGGNYALPVASIAPAPLSGSSTR